MEKVLGDYMLKGWILLADNCPTGCNVPMIQDRISGTRKCVNCGLEHRKDTKSIGANQEHLKGSKPESCDTIVSEVSAILDRKLKSHATLLEGCSSADSILVHLQILERIIAVKESLKLS